MRTLLSLFFYCVSVSPLAEEAESRMRICQSVYDVAITIMTARQENLPMPTVIKATLIGNDAQNAFTLELVKKAYTYPRFNTKEAKAEWTQEFANKMYNSCL